MWVGWGFVAEHAEFAELCREMGIVYHRPGCECHAAAGRQNIVQASGGAGPDSGCSLERGPVETVADAAVTPSAWATRC